MRHASNVMDRPRELSRFGKILLLLLVAYVTTLILPDTLRPSALYQQLYSFVGLDSHHQPTAGWYPLGVVCFDADNNGKVTSVHGCAPARGHLQEGDQIDLRATAMTDRRAIIEGGGRVAHDRPVVLQIIHANRARETVELMPRPEDLRFFGTKWPNTWTLMLDQLAGLFFIGLAALCVWRAPSPVTWGFFVYALYFNSGDLEVWWANLPAEAVRWLGWSLAVIASAGLAGILMFALYFPRHSVRNWRRAVVWLFFPFATLAALNLWSFRNYTEGISTEAVYDAYYYLFLATYLAVFALFFRTYVTQPADRPRIRWVILGALSGLLCFILAEVYTQTSMLNNLPLTIHQWQWQTLYAVNVLFPIAVTYAILRHRVINVRLVLNRSGVAAFGFIVVLVAYELLYLTFHRRVERWPWIALAVGLISILAHERLRKIKDFMNWLFYRKWYIAERDLKKAAEGLTRVTQVEAVNHALIDVPANDLDLTLAGLFERKTDEAFYRVHATPSWPGTLLQVIPAHDSLLASLQARPLVLSDGYWKGKLPAPQPYPVQMPILAVPIAIGRVLSRLALFGPHANGETFDRDEVDIIDKLAQSAGLAYTTLQAEEVETLRSQIRDLQVPLKETPGLHLKD
ncbi:MAG TPA: hypothetical protein VKZ50_17840 [bacterium]|nr:hypothetical protein [bacterium]